MCHFYCIETPLPLPKSGVSTECRFIFFKIVNLHSIINLFTKGYIKNVGFCSFSTIFVRKLQSNNIRARRYKIIYKRKFGGNLGILAKTCVEEENLKNPDLCCCALWALVLRCRSSPVQTSLSVLARHLRTAYGLAAQLRKTVKTEKLCEPTIIDAAITFSFSWFFFCSGDIP